MLQKQRKVFRIRAASENRNQPEVRLLRASIESDTHLLIDPMPHAGLPYIVADIQWADKEESVGEPSNDVGGRKWRFSGSYIITGSWI